MLSVCLGCCFAPHQEKVSSSQQQFHEQLLHEAQATALSHFERAERLQAEAAETAGSHTAALEASDTAVGALQYMQAQMEQEQHAMLVELASWVQLSPLAAAAAAAPASRRGSRVVDSPAPASTPGHGGGFVVSEADGGTKLVITNTGGVSAIDLHNLDVSNADLSDGGGGSNSLGGGDLSSMGSATPWPAAGDSSYSAAALAASSPSLVAAAAVDAAGRAAMGDYTWMLTDEQSGFSSTAPSVHHGGATPNSSQIGSRLAAVTAHAAASGSNDMGGSQVVPRRGGHSSFSAASPEDDKDHVPQASSLVSQQEMTAQLYRQAEAMGLDREIIDDALEAFEGSHTRVRAPTVQPPRVKLAIRPIRLMTSCLISVLLTAFLVV